MFIDDALDALVMFPSSRMSLDAHAPVIRTITATTITFFICEFLFCGRAPAAVPEPFKPDTRIARWL
jgi:hypothetical protein